MADVLEGLLRPINVLFLETCCMNSFHRHVPIRELAEHLTGELSLLKRLDVELHVSMCAHCAATLADLDRLIKGIRTDMARDDPDSVIDRAVELFRLKKLHPSTEADLPRRVLAVLRFDSAGLAPALGVRSDSLGARQLLFHAGAVEIDLRIEPADQHWTVSGQILGASPARGRVVLQNLISMSVASLSELSEFVLTPVQAGTYQLVLKLMTAEIEVEEIRIGF